MSKSEQFHLLEVMDRFPLKKISRKSTPFRMLLSGIRMAPCGQGIQKDLYVPRCTACTLLIECIQTPPDMIDSQVQMEFPLTEFTQWPTTWPKQGQRFQPMVGRCAAQR